MFMYAVCTYDVCTYLKIISKKVLMLCYVCVFRGLRFNVEAHRGRHAISLPIEFINLQPDFLCS